MPHPNVQYNVRRYDSKAATAQDMAAHSAAFLQQCIDENGVATLALTGGGSPTALYSTWARDFKDKIDWSKVHLFWGDERNVPLSDEDSNVQTAKLLTDHVAVPQANLHPWRTDLDAPQALEEMQQSLAKIGVAGPQWGIDLTLLGVGPDGHVASLFPQATPWKALGDDDAPDVAFIDDSPKPPAERFTFTLPMLNRSRVIYLMPFGDSKKGALHGLLHADPSLPVSYVEGREQTIVWTDLQEE